MFATENQITEVNRMGMETEERRGAVPLVYAHQYPPSTAYFLVIGAAHKY